MKKRLLAILLSALLVANVSACSYVPENEFEDKTSETTTRTESLDTNDTESPSLESESNSDTSNQNETVRNVSGIGKLKLHHNFTKASTWRDETGEWYIYINNWDAYRPLQGLSSLSFYPYLGEYTGNSITVDDETAAIAVINQVGKHDEPTIITYHFNRSNNLVEFHAVPLNIKASSEDDTFLVNMHDANHGYYFLTPNMWGDMDDRMSGVHEWPLFMFETTDGGKSWNQISTHTFHGTKYVEILQFVSPQVGIFSFTNRDERYDLCERTFLTVDGGLTWYQISQLPYPPLDKVWGYSEVVDMEYSDDCYYLTVKLAYNHWKELQFWSKDLINWTLIET